MQENHEDGQNKRQGNLFSIYMFRFLPYWPLFLLLVLICGFGAYLFMRYSEPKYDITASLLIRDEKKGADESKALEAINIYNSKKIVENETEILHSHTLIVEVVNNLHLYAPVFEFGHIQPVSAYISSPVDIEAEVPEAITNQGPINISLVNNQLKANGHLYDLDKWVMTPWGKLRFNRNENQRKRPARPLYFNLIPPKKVVD
jgi:tyrosine-protein kinase Etk/Wzc